MLEGLIKALRIAGVVAASVAVAVLVGGCGTRVTGDGGSTAREAAETTPAATREEAGAMELTSSWFADGGAMPQSTARNAGNQSPPLAWTGVPTGTKSFAITCIDLNPVAGGWVHWLASDVPAGTMSLKAGASGADMPEGSREFANTFGQKGWGGPQPPAGTGAHDYEFTIYALDVAKLDVAPDAVAEDVVSAIQEHTLSSARLVGTFER